MSLLSWLHNNIGKRIALCINWISCNYFFKNIRTRLRDEETTVRPQPVDPMLAQFHRRIAEKAAVHEALARKSYIDWHHETYGRYGMNIRYNPPPRVHLEDNIEEKRIGPRQ